MNLRTLRIQQIDQLLISAKGLGQNTNFPKGFINTIRGAIGLTNRQLAKRLDVSISSVALSQKKEVSGTITIAQMQRYAEALNCYFKYSFVPKTPLTEVIQQQAEQLAQKRVEYIHRISVLDGKEVSNDFQKQLIGKVKSNLLNGSWSRLWD